IVSGFSISIDGFGAGPEQSLTNRWANPAWNCLNGFSPRKTSGRLPAEAAGPPAAAETIWRAPLAGFVAFFLGRNMFGPVRGDWPDDEWKGWWGNNPPYHAPTFVLTHHARDPIVMEGGTVFHFVSAGIEVALKMAKAAADDKDIKIGGGVSTVRQYL